MTTALTPTQALRSMGEALARTRLQGTFYPLGPDSPRRLLRIGPELYISLLEEPGESQRDYTIDICFLNDVLAEAGEAPSPFSDTLEFTVVLPFQIPLLSLDNTAAVMAIANAILPFGRFCLNHQGAPLFRYGLKIQPTALKLGVLLEVIEGIQFFVDRLANKLEMTALNKYSYAEAVHEIELSMGQPPSTLAWPDDHFIIQPPAAN